MGKWSKYWLGTLNAITPPKTRKRFGSVYALKKIRTER